MKFRPFRPAASLVGMINKYSFLSLLSFTLIASACASSVALENRPCPCASGWVCCETNNICVAPGMTFCMTTDRDHLYWQNANGLVVGVDKSGGELQISHFQTPIASNAKCGIAVDGTQLFTTSYQYGKLLQLELQSNGQWSIGGAGTMFGTLTTPSSLVVDEEAIYVTEYERGAVSKIMRSNIEATVELASGLLRPDSIVADAANLYWINRGTPNPMARVMDGSIMRLTKTTGLLTTLKDGIPAAGALTIAGDKLFWTSEEGTVNTMSVEGGEVTVLSEREVLAGGPIAVDAESVFTGSSGVRAISRASAGVNKLYDALHPNSLVVDEARVYWSDGDAVWTGLKVK